MATNKLWILRPVKEIKDREKDNPWNPWFDRAFGFVVRAKTETEARELAHSQAGDENGTVFLPQRVNARTPWLDNEYSTCVVLDTDGKQKL